MTRNIALVTAATAAAFALTTLSATAAVVCNAEGDCWHTKTTYEYRPEFKLTVHPDDWKWKEGERHAWREHEGRGYWQGGAWREF